MGVVEHLAGLRFHHRNVGCALGAGRLRGGAVQNGLCLHNGRLKRNIGRYSHWLFDYHLFFLNVLE